jgi:hypothetical protein
MPKTKFQGVIFGLLMSYTMAIGMEIYNIAVKMGFGVTVGGLSNMTNAVFPAALAEAAYMGVFVFLFSNLWGNRIGAAFARTHTDPRRDSPYLCQLLRQAGTVAVMCPTMSLVASILFNLVRGGVPAGQLPAVWVGTVLKNFPMAFFWNFFAAAPLSRCVFRLLFRQGEAPQPAAAPRQAES